MRSIKTELESIKAYIERKINEENFRMAMEPDEHDDESPIKLIKPRVAIGNIPHSNFSLYDNGESRFYQAPYLLVGYESASFGPSDEEIDILIQGCAYTAVSYDTAGGGAVVGFPDAQGILDVSQMLERVMGWVRQIPSFPAMMDFTIGSYSTVAYTYPFNFGYLAFKVKTNVGAMPRKSLF